MKIDLFGPVERKPRRVMLHARDSGIFPDGKLAAEFACTKCHYDSGWIYATSPDIRRGIPCPLCNAAHIQGSNREG